MRTYHIASLLIAACVAISGCSSIDNRIQKNSDVFSSLTATDQKRLRDGLIAVGDTTDMVSIALGEPDRRMVLRSASGDRIQWIYDRLVEVYEGREPIGVELNTSDLRLLGYRSPGGVGPGISNNPKIEDTVYTDVTEVSVQANVIVTFANGRVLSVDKLKR